jgi:hypothetical protein
MIRQASVHSHSVARSSMVSTSNKLNVAAVKLKADCTSVDQDEEKKKIFTEKILSTNNIEFNDGKKKLDQLDDSKEFLSNEVKTNMNRVDD